MRKRKIAPSPSWTLLSFANLMVLLNYASKEKKTHTDQYLQFTSHHPLHQKLGVIRTLLDRNELIVTEEEDRKLEEEHVRKALSVCGYPEWTINKVKKDRSRPNLIPQIQIEQHL